MGAISAAITAGKAGFKGFKALAGSFLDGGLKSKKTIAKVSRSKVSKRELRNDTKAYQGVTSLFSHLHDSTRQRVSGPHKGAASLSAKGGRLKVSGKQNSKRTIDAELIQSPHDYEITDVGKIISSLVKSKSPVTKKRLITLERSLKNIRKRSSETSHTKLDFLEGKLDKLKTQALKGTGKLRRKVAREDNSLDY